MWQAIAARARVSGEAGVAAPLCFGSFGFFPDTPGALIVPRTLYCLFDQRAWVIEQSVEGSDAACPPLPDERGAVEGPGSTRVRDGAHSRTDYLAILTDLIARLRAGEARKVVLARDVVVEAEAPVRPGWVAARLARAYPTCWTYAVDGLVGATPEMLAEVRDAHLYTRVLAGTAGADDAEALAASAKDRREHALAVDSVRRALTPLCEHLDIPEEPEILTLPNVTHLSSTVRAIARVTSLQAAGALHPTAAVCGTPTAEAAEIIAQIEEMDRGRYAGPVGWMDSRGNGQWGIALRCGIVSENGLSVRVLAGGGIMPDSEPEREFAETQAKMLPVLAALGCGENGQQTG
nr:isochorismate synthase [Nanchangia anserum]